MRFDPSKYLFKKYNRLLVTGFVKTPDGRMRAVCLCDCGNQTVTRVSAVVQGKTASCGCGVGEAASKTAVRLFTTHGQAPKGQVTPIYKAWSKIRWACAKGVARGAHHACHDYDPRWEDFEEFLKDFGPISAGQTVCRRNRKSTWCKENCYIDVGQGVASE